ncbi:hypothetical protein E2C01_055776 [Portunus trituberculatus]|uniref:Uncharacterized protein n=1 Tax=Portunus trituberculatus TaxID=210409 RepID=A0A5B7GS66_PORTR|nr:hypothetical protein [Portunus trituberculatus]
MLWMSMLPIKVLCHENRKKLAEKALEKFKKRNRDGSAARVHDMRQKLTEKQRSRSHWQRQALRWQA